MRPKLAVVVLSLLAVLVSCDSPNAPRAEKPQYDYMNGPDDLPHVARFEGHVAVNIVDPETGLRAVAGLPVVPSAHIACRVFGFTGSERFQLLPIQDVGTEPPFVRLIASDDVNLHVYEIRSFLGFCRSTVHARGTGRLTSNDNDLTFSGERWNVWGWHFTGNVTVLASGETKRLNAFIKFRARRGEGPVEILTRKVHLID